MSAAWAGAFFDLAYPTIAGAAMVMARTLGTVMITPAFNRLGLSGLLRSAVALVIALPVMPAMFAAMSQGAAPSGAMLAVLLIKEMTIGMVLGVIFGVPFWAAEAAGDLIDLQRGSTMAQLLDPLGSGESSVTSTLFAVTLIALFFASGGFLVMLDGIYRSYGLWPPLSLAPPLTSASAYAVLGLLDHVMQVGALMIAPIVIAVLVADILLAYLSRMAPSLHVFDLSLPVKNLLFAFLMVLYVAYLLPFMMSALGDLTKSFSRFEAQVQGIATD